jgi:hypothetical protein
MASFRSKIHDGDQPLPGLSDRLWIARRVAELHQGRVMPLALILLLLLLLLLMLYRPAALLSICRQAITFMRDMEILKRKETVLS